MNTTDTSIGQASLNQTPQPQATCPHCGYCPHCGRANPYQAAPYPYPYWIPYTVPIYPGTIGPYWSGGGNWCASAGNMSISQPNTQCVRSLS